MNKQELLQITAEQVGRMSEEELRIILSNIYQCIDQDLLDKALQDTKEKKSPTAKRLKESSGAIIAPTVVVPVPGLRG